MPRSKALRKVKSLRVMSRAKPETEENPLPLEMLPESQLPTLAELEASIEDALHDTTSRSRPSCPAALKCVGYKIREVPRYSNSGVMSKHCCPVGDCPSILSNPKAYEQCIGKRHFQVCMAHGYGTAIAWGTTCPACDSILAKGKKTMREQEEQHAMEVGAMLTPTQRKKGVTPEWQSWVNSCGKVRKQRSLGVLLERAMNVDEDGENQAAGVAVRC